ncbi:EAL domain-containing protein [Silanimonas sp.]|uniref:EAL domain-containing protein n=1 Tax=Silanimonas sp. TaxID=1929290 RepID=UPI0022CAD87D|nr:EAL domain-containing protein [Silanimonas sp.]MCZ8114677.1 EAL domain-containing protein [Silanimonas sp.]
MPAARLPDDESERLAALRALGVLDTPPEPELDAVVRAAAAICGTPISLVSLVDADRQWFKANRGLEGVEETPRELAFCAHALLGEGLLEVEDAMRDARFADDALAAGAPPLRFHAGMPLVLADGARIGTLCVIDRVPRRLDDRQREALAALAEAAVRIMEGWQRDRRDAARATAELARLSQVVRFTSHSVIVADAEGRATWVNDGFTRISGYAPHDVIGRKPGTVLQVPETDAATVATIRAALSRGEGCRVEILNGHKDGRRYWADLEIQPLFAADGRVEGYMAIQSDITSRKTDEAALRRSETLLNSIGEVVGVGGWALDLASGRLDWTQETRRLHGVSDDFVPTVDEAIGFYAPEARDTMRVAVEAGLREGRPWDLELPLRRRDGTSFWARAVGRPVFEGDRVVRLIGAFQDITAQRAQRLAIEDARERMALAVDSGHLGVWHVDTGTNQSHWDDWVFRQYGRPATGQPVAYADWIEWLHPGDRAPLMAEVRRVMAGQTTTGIEFRVVWPDGSIRHLRSALRAVKADDGRPTRLVGINWDVTAQRLAEADLRRERELLQVTLQSIGDAVVTTDVQGHVTWLNPVAERLTGWSSDEAQGLPAAQMFRIVDEETRQPARDPVMACLLEGRVVGLAPQTLLLSRDGREYGVEDSAAPIRDADGTLLGAVLVFHDVTEQRRLGVEMRFRATHDALTGLHNREELEARLREALADAADGETVHALMYIDLDQFKVVNDTCGHAAGDQLLQQVARLLGDTVRSGDLLARLGGDEFAVLMERCTPEQGQRVAQQICDRLEIYRFDHDGHRFRIGASIGLAPVDARFPTAESALQAADSACFAAKEEGRNRVHLWFDSDAAIQARQGEAQWATRLERALDEGRFVLYAQRIDALQGDAGGLHAEVLLRLVDVNGALVSPAGFLPAAERFHLASRIDRWVLGEALARMAAIGDGGMPAMLSVNLSGQSVGDRAFHRHAVARLEAAGPGVCARLCVEITETAAVTNMADAIVFIERVRGLGVRVALDDFGAGASSWGYLKALRVDYLKIDGQFVRDVVDDALDEAAVRSFVEVARVLGARTVAEFVDRPEVLARVRQMGVDYAQGYLLHRPEPLEAVLGRAVGVSTPG